MKMKKGDVCIVNLSEGAGREQYGERPAVLISNTKTDIAVVIPLTTNLEALRFPYVLAILPDKYNNLAQESAILIFHIKAVDKTRITKVVGRINREMQKKINIILKNMLKL